MCTGMTSPSRGVSLFGKVRSLTSCLHDFRKPMSVPYMCPIAGVLVVAHLMTQAKASHSASSSSSSTSQSVTNEGRRLQAVVVDACVHSTPGRMKTMAADPQTVSNPCPGPPVWPSPSSNQAHSTGRKEMKRDKMRQVSKVKLSVPCNIIHCTHTMHILALPRVSKDTEVIPRFNS